MSAPVERLLARLYTDERLLRRFLADPAALAREAGLSPEEAAAVTRIDLDDLALAAHGFARKRASRRA